MMYVFSVTQNPNPNPTPQWITVTFQRLYSGDTPLRKFPNLLNELVSTLVLQI